MEPPQPAGATPGSFGSVKPDLLASVVVFLVALPLCMGVAIASGVPPEKAAAVGIITGIVGGLVVGLLAGCPLQVSGPAAGLAVIVGQLIAVHGFATLGLIVMVAGAVQFLAGLFRLGQWFRAMSPAVIQGMLAGIGMLIFAAQFHVMVDDAPPGSGIRFGGIINLYTIPEATWKGLTEDVHQGAAGIGVLTILAIIGWTFLAPKKLKIMPAPLFAVLLAASVAAALRLDIRYISVPDQLTDAIAIPAAGEWLRLLDWSILGAGLALAFVASAESLLTATAADAMQQHAARTKYDRELVAQGVGNLVCGLLGALPMTGVIVRTSANIQAGGRTRASTMLHGLWLLVFAVLFPQVLRLIPIASLAAILVYTGWKLMNPKAVRALWQYGKGEAAIYAATLATIVIADLLTGILVGLSLALAKLLYTFSHLVARLVVENGRTILYLKGAATFIRLPKLAAILQEVPVSTELHVHFEELTYIDHGCLDLLIHWEKQHQATGGRLVIDWERLTARFHQYGQDLGEDTGPPAPILATEPQARSVFPIKAILHPTDFSEHASFAFQQTCAMAREHGARLIILHVCPSVVATSEIEAAMVPSEADKELLRAELSRLQPRDPNVSVEHILQAGEPVEEILRVARERHCDLIVMGTHGRTGLSRLLMGSVAEAVVRTASCPVVTIKGPPLSS
jgi:MFS superfamily sulfate permease-like transporter/nucleotide-binding universal stress UspA family protein